MHEITLCLKVECHGTNLEKQMLRVSPAIPWDCRHSGPQLEVGDPAEGGWRCAQCPWPCWGGEAAGWEEMVPDHRAGFLVVCGDLPSRPRSWLARSTCVEPHLVPGRPASPHTWGRQGEMRTQCSRASWWHRWRTSLGVQVISIPHCFLPIPVPARPLAKEPDPLAPCRGQVGGGAQRPEPVSCSQRGQGRGLTSGKGASQRGSCQWDCQEASLSRAICSTAWKSSPGLLPSSDLGETPLGVLPSQTSPPLLGTGGLGPSNVRGAAAP